MYLTHPLMAIDPCAKYGMMLKLTEVQVGHEDMTKAYKVDLELKGQHECMCHMVIDHCAKYGKPVSNQK